MKALVLLFFIIPGISLGQNITFDFENKDLTNWYQNISGHWTISEEDPIAGDFSLKHHFDNDVTSSDWISLFHDPLQLNRGIAIWEFSIRYDFNPSSNNHWLVMISENSLPGSNPENALVFGVNYEGTGDELQLWAVHNGETEIVLNTGFNWEQSIEKEEPVRFRLNSYESGVFTIEMDTSGGAFFIIGEAFITLPETPNIFTLYYKYTSNYDQGLTFDDLTIKGNFSNDSVSPFVEAISILNPQCVEIDFSELVKIMDSQEFCIEGAGCAFSDYGAAKTCVLEIPGLITPGNTYYLHLPAIVDMYGNKLSATTSTKHFYYPKAYDVMINEVLADPSPPVLLPETEFIELYNRSDKEISMKGWHLTIHDKTIELPPEIIPPGGYATLFHSGEDAFDTMMHAISCKHFPALNNAGAEVRLQDRSGRLIHAVKYSCDWFETSSKKEGGWSLEMVDPDDPCAAGSNWRESSDYRGGTPGEENSVYDSPGNNSSPELWRVAVTKSESLMLYFSEPLDSARSISAEYFRVDHGMGMPDSIHPAWPILDKAELFFKRSFEKNQVYEISITSDVSDCSDKAIKNSLNFPFSVSFKADSADLVINEIMFDPEYGFTEYIELYNRSGKTVDLKDYSLRIGEPDDDTLLISPEYFPVEAGAYVIVAGSYTGIDSPEMFSGAERIAYMGNMPRIPNEGSQVYLFTGEANICDAASYSPAYHHDLLTDSRGVALERISCIRSGLEPDNWHSASSDAGYQTPAAPNSQNESENSVFQVEISPKTITPNGDGLDDELLVRYKMETQGYMIRIMVFDKNGRKINTLANGEILGTEGQYIFNGKDYNGGSLASGYYILFFDAYNEKGDRHRVKKSFVVARN